MKNLIALALAVVAGAPWLSHAQAPATAPPSGKVIVLDNEATMTGAIERDGDTYRVRRLTGEVSVPARRVVRLCASMEEAYAFLRSRANHRDPDERLRLSNWCRQHGLRAHALVEIEEAARLRPEDSRLRRMARAMRDSLARPAPKPVGRSVQSPLQRIDVRSDTLAVFATKVQPMLMNACAGCHTGKRGGKFDLIRTHGIGISDQRSLDHNLAAVAAQIDPRDPGRSKILTKAVTLHAKGMTAPPLQGKHKMAAARMLESWVRQAAASNPGLQPPAAPVPPPNAVAVTPAPPSVFGAGRPAAKAQPAESPKPASDEPASPDAFNQEFHGEKPDK